MSIPYGNRGSESNAFSLIHERVARKPRDFPHAIICFTDIIGSSSTYVPRPLKGFLIARKKFESAKEILDDLPFRTDVAIIKTIGDALMLFGTNPDILIAFIKRLTELANCKFRTTIHAGRVLLWQTPFNSGNDCFGHTVNLASRLEQENKIWADRSTTKIEFPLLITAEALSISQSLDKAKLKGFTINTGKFFSGGPAEEITYFCADIAG